MASPTDEQLGSTAVLVIPAQPGPDESADDRMASIGSGDGTHRLRRDEAKPAGARSRTRARRTRAARTTAEPATLDDLVQAATLSVTIIPDSPPDDGPATAGDAVPDEPPAPPPAPPQTAVQVAVMVAAAGRDAARRDAASAAEADQAEMDEVEQTDIELAGQAARTLDEAVFGDPETAELAATAVAYACAAAAAAEAFAARAGGTGPAGAGPRAAERQAVREATREATQRRAAGVKAAARAIAVRDWSAARRPLGELDVASPATGVTPAVAAVRVLPQICRLLEDLDGDVRRQWHGVLSEPVVSWLLPEGEAADTARTETAPGPVGLLRDVAIARRLEAELRTEQEHLQEAFDHAPAALVLAAGPPHPDGSLGRVLRVNRAMCELTGFTETELLAAPLHDLLDQRDVPVADGGAGHGSTPAGDRMADRVQRWTRGDGSGIVVRVRLRALWRGPDREPLLVGAAQEVPLPAATEPADTRTRRRRSRHRPAADG